MASRDSQHPTALISYSHDSPEHEARVLELANRLRGDGIDCDLDQYVSGGLPPLGWLRWMQDRIESCDFTIMVCTETYARRVAHKEPPRIGRGVVWEADLLYTLLNETDDFRTRIVPIVMEGSSIDDIPLPVRGNRIDLRPAGGYQQLLRRLHGIAAAAKPALGSGLTWARLTGRSSQWSAFRPPWFVPSHRRSDYFTGRDGLLARLRDAMTKRGRVALCGLGGVGKTQAALEYAHRHRDRYPGGVFWVGAENATVLTTGFIDIAKRLQLGAAAQDDEAATAEAVMQWFDENDDWLLVLDNLDDPEVARAHLPGSTGHVLATTRRSTLQELGISACIDVLEFIPEEAVQFLFDRTGRRDDDADESAAVKLLADALGFFPLALEQAAAFIAENSSRFSAYLASFRKRHLEVLARSPALAGGYRETIATTWAANFEAVVQCSPASADVLRLSAFLHSDRIPFDVLEAVPDPDSPIGLALSDPDDPLQVDQLLTPLSRYSLIRRDPENRSYSVHRLVQDVVREAMDDGTHALWLGQAIVALELSFPEIAYANWDICDRLLPHAQALARRVIDEAVESSWASDLLNDTAFYLLERARFSEARPLCEAALTISERAYGPDHPAVAAGLTNLARVLYKLGRYGEALSLNERALAIRERRLGPDHPDVAVSLSNVSKLLFTEGRYDEALPLGKRALAIAERALGPDHADVGPILDVLAGVLEAQGRYAEAQSLSERDLASTERALGPDDPSVATSLNNLAGLLRAQGRYAEAQPLYERALAIDERALGPEHPNVAIDLNNFAGLLRVLGRGAEALSLYERAVAIEEGALGPDHPELATSLNNFARLLREQDRHADAQQLFERALAIRERALGPDHPDVASTLHNLSELAYAQGRYADAQPLIERAVAIEEHALGPDHPKLATSLNDLAELYRAQGLHAEAKPLLRRARAIRKRADT